MTWRKVDQTILKCFIFFFVAATIWFAATALHLIWLLLEFKYGPLFPEWFYYLINLEI